MSKVKSLEQILEQSRLAIKIWAGKNDDEWLIKHLDDLAWKLRDRFDADTMAMIERMKKELHD